MTSRTLDLTTGGEDIGANIVEGGGVDTRAWRFGRRICGGFRGVIELILNLKDEAERV